MTEGDVTSGGALDVARALDWRLERHALAPVAGTDAVDVVRRVVAQRAWPREAAEASVAVRLAVPLTVPAGGDDGAADAGTLDRALAAGTLVRAYAFRGGSYLMAPDDAADLLTVRCTTRIWETARYQAQVHFALADWAPLRAAVRDALADGPLIRPELADHLARTPDLAHLAQAAASGAGSDALIKPLHWWRDVCFGPDRDGLTTFRLATTAPSDLEESLSDAAIDAAGRRSVLRYLASYGPATWANLDYWLTEGLSVPRRRLRTWVAELGDQVTEVMLDGEPRLVRSADLEQMRGVAGVRPADSGGCGGTAGAGGRVGGGSAGGSSFDGTAVVRLLPAYDPWTLGPGTADALVVPPARRALATRGSPLVIRDGIVTGAWRRVRERGRTRIVVTWFAESGAAPEAALAAEVARLGRALGEASELELELAVEP
ncbi:winged helix DNA-binding domain-containing protein [Miniimonas arenae]|uniref:Winged helix DNA-binding domain-containing protein n=1 Tax=Miniimonas arenae TaxID=676201 RepID=A0A5C5B922_9MICO|nr:crosslink repair DNA glycosylase YcaQ family protein [Miniimonas arenae]TNU73201.1 winged helix DNA-binding domain-containing protein [Miniimonas arenae]